MKLRSRSSLVVLVPFIGGVLLLGLAGCSADAVDVASREQALMGGGLLGNLDDDRLSDAAVPRLCRGNERLGVRQSLILGRTLANSRALSECLQVVMMTGFDQTTGSSASIYDGPYAGCPNDPYASLPRDLQVMMVQSQLTTPDALTVTCVGGTFVDGAAVEGNSNEEVWISAGKVRTAAEDSLDDESDFAERTSPLAGVAGTFWHEAFHTFGYNHAGGSFGPPCGWDVSVPYFMNSCIEEVWEASLEHCDQSMCKNGRDLAVIRDFAALDAGETDGLECECVNDSSGGVDPLALLPSIDGYLPADPFAFAANGNQRFGHALATGDFDNDGFTDLAVGIPGKIAGSDTGAVAVYHGSVFGLYPHVLLRPGLANAVSGGEFGFALTAADLDGNGASDLIVGAPGQNRIFAYAGNDDVGLRAAGSHDGSGRFGESLLVLTTDRLPMKRFLVVGSPEKTVSGRVRAGAVTFFNPYFEVGGLGLEEVADLSEAGFGGAVANARFGHALATEDVRGSSDGFDLVVGAPGAGRVHVFDNSDLPSFGDPDADDFAGWQPDLTIEPDDVIGTAFGSAIALPNFDANPTHSIVVGTAVHSGGSGEQSVYVFAPNGELTDEFRSSEPTFGATLFVTDLDDVAPNWDDVIVGAPGISAVFALTAGLDEDDNAAPRAIQPPIALSDRGSAYGYAFVRSDFNADGVQELVIGAPQLAVNGLVAGGVLTHLVGEAGADLSSIAKVFDLDDVGVTGSLGRLVPPFGGFEEIEGSRWMALPGRSIDFDFGLRTEGASSMAFAPGYTEAVSPAFAASDWRLIGTELLLDVYVPAAQPASGWKGALQMYFTFPGSNAFHQYIGQIELTPLASGQWHTVSFPVSSTLRGLFLGSEQAAQLFVTVNTDPAAPARTNIDNLRFGGTLTEHPSSGASSGGGSTPTGASFVCAGPCLNATLLSANEQSGAFETLGEVWFEISDDVLGWQASEVPGRTVRVNGVQVDLGQMPLPARAGGKYYVQFTEGAHPWGSFSFW